MYFFSQQAEHAVQYTPASGLRRGPRFAAGASRVTEESADRKGAGAVAELYDNNNCHNGRDSW